MSVTGLFRARYTPIERFAVFGESGVTYAAPESVSIATADIKRRTVNLTGRIGVVLFFK